jgi:hypothetical protein
MTNRTDRRLFRRATVGDEPGLVGRIRPGFAIRVLDISAGGALIETRKRLLPGSSVELHLEAEQRRSSVRAIVVRCYVSRLTSVDVEFVGGLEFDLPVTWPTQLLVQGEPHTDTRGESSHAGTDYP